MPLYSYKNIRPTIFQHAFVASSADLVGKVIVHAHANVWFNVVARGDEHEIIIGENTNVQDLTMLHVTKKHPLHIGSNVTIGHHVVLHGCVIEDHCLIGMGAIILDGAVIKKGSVVAGGSVVPPGKTYPENSMIMGSPARAIRELTEAEKNQYHNHYKTYLVTKNEYLNSEIVKLIN